MWKYETFMTLSVQNQRGLSHSTNWHIMNVTSMLYYSISVILNIHTPAVVKRYKLAKMGACIFFNGIHNCVNSHKSIDGELQARLTVSALRTWPIDVGSKNEWLCHKVPEIVGCRFPFQTKDVGGRGMQTILAHLTSTLVLAYSRLQINQMHGYDLFSFRVAPGHHPVTFDAPLTITLSAVNTKAGTLVLLRTH